MHAGKTELILFASQRKLRKVEEFQVNFQGHIIKGQKYVKYIRSYKDEDLSGKSMIENIVKKFRAE